MKLKERNLVEVLRRGNEPWGSWFIGKLVSADGDSCIVRYKLLVDHDGAQVVDKVPCEDVRPQPPHDKGKRWMTGDIAEVFDIHSWRVGTVAKVLKNNCVHVRLFGSIQFKEFHKSKLRIRQIWHNNKWSVIGKVGRNKQIAMRKTASYTLHSFRPPLSNEDSDQCSIASCSYNEYTDNPGQNSRKPLEHTSDCSDEESLFPSKSRVNHSSPSHRDKLQVHIHKLELNAYESTVRALYVSGPLSWEKESLLTNLRLSLHISDEEHLLLLRYLLSTQFLS